MKFRLIVYFSLLILNMVQHVFAETFVEEVGESTGGLALGLVGIGFIYVVLRRAQILSKKLGEDQQEIKDLIRKSYRTFRLPLLQLHYAVNIAATIAAVIHGILLSDAGWIPTVFGWIAAGSMIILSFSGILIWHRFKPIWDYRTSRTAIRYLHRQWLFTGILFIALIIHSA